MALTKLNYTGQGTIPIAKIPTITGAKMPASSIIKVQTNPITAFGTTNLTTSFIDIAGTEQSFTRTVSNSKILVTFNLKLTSLQGLTLRLNRKIGSGSYAVVNNGASGTNSGRTSELGVFGCYYNTITINAMGYGIHSDIYNFLDESGEGLSNTTDAITYKLTCKGATANSKVFLNITGYDGTGGNFTTESSVTFTEIKV